MRKLNIQRGDLIAFAIALVLLIVLMVGWSFVLTMPENTAIQLALQKDLLLYGTFITAAIYGLLGTALTLGSVPAPRGARVRGLNFAILAVVVPLALAFGLEFVAAWVSTFIPSELGYLVPMLQLVIATVLMAASAFFAFRGAAMPGQVPLLAYLRFGIGLMLLPTLAFLLHMLMTSDWRGATRGVVMGNAMLHGLLYGIFYAGLIAANMLQRPATPAASARH